MTSLTSPSIRGELVRANGAELYCERRGRGPSVLFISGATGDAGHFSRVADLLADDFTVLTYDRRGNSRSPRPAGWTATSSEEQADDAAALLRALDLAAAIIYGNSGAPSSAPACSFGTRRWCAALSCMSRRCSRLWPIGMR